MKDSQGREYDGWTTVNKYDNRPLVFVADRTRADMWKRFDKIVGPDHRDNFFAAKIRLDVLGEQVNE